MQCAQPCVDLLHALLGFGVRVRVRGVSLVHCPQPLIDLLQALAGASIEVRRRGLLQQPIPALSLGFGRIVASEIEAPNMLVNLV